MIVLIDNYDSFTYNLVQRLGEIDPDVDLLVVRNDQVTLDEIEAKQPTHLIISPGPCTPREAGISNEVVERFGPRIPLLGVCLGHQCIGHTFGAKIVRADRIMHGKTSLIHHDGQGIYRGLSNPFEATRYHSLVIQPGTLSDDFDGRRLDRPGRDHGRPPQDVSPGRRAVPPRELSDARGDAPAQELPRAGRRRVGTRDADGR